MSVPIPTSRSTYVGNGATVDFNAGFYFLDEADVVVRLTPSGGVEVVQTLGVHYTVTMPAGVGLNGSITMLVAPPLLSSLVIERTVPFIQDTSFRTSGNYAASRHEDATDEVVFQTQQLHRRVSDLESAGAPGSVVAGNGLSFAGTTLHVGAGAGIQSNADTVEVIFGNDPAEMNGSASDAFGPYTPGALDKAARIDHQHQVFTGAPAAGAVAVGNVAAIGASSVLSRADHVHEVAAGVPVDVTKAAAAEGGSTAFSRADHKHDISTAAAIDVTDAANAEGVAASLARSDHTHAHGARGGGTLHANAVAGGAAGFQKGLDKEKLDYIKGTGLRDYQTVDATPVTFNALSASFFALMAGDSVALVEVDVVAIIADGTVGAAWRLVGAYRKDGAADLVDIGAHTVEYAKKDAGAAAWDAVLDAGAHPGSGGKPPMTITGQAATTINWRIQSRWSVHGVVYFDL